MKSFVAIVMTSMLGACTLALPFAGATIAGVHNLAVADGPEATTTSTPATCTTRRVSGDGTPITATDLECATSAPRSPPESPRWSVGKTMGWSLLVGFVIDSTIIISSIGKGWT